MDKKGMVSLKLKCKPEVDCTVKRTIISVNDINLKIHLLANCLRCSGRRAPEFDTIR